jgi:hypothetical protein
MRDINEERIMKVEIIDDAAAPPPPSLDYS